MKLKFFTTILILISYQCYNSPRIDVSNNKTPEINKVDDVVLKNETAIVKELNIEIKEMQLDRNELVAFAKTFTGTPYVYAKQDPKIGFDCSGFINYIFKNFNISVPRSSSGFKDFGKEIYIENVRIGDVLVFTGYQDRTVIGHLGIVCEANGMNSKFIHASSGKAMQVTISDLNSTHYAKRFLKVVDVIND
jgi:hypothetical protein